MMHLASGHTAEALQGEELERQERDFQGYTNGMVRLNPGRWLFPADYTSFADKLYRFKFRKSDVVVMTWPKCGTTWMQEIVWTMKNNPDLNNPEAKIPTRRRVHFLDFDMLTSSKNIPSYENNPACMAAFRKVYPNGNIKDGVMLQLVEATPDPRTIKTHLPFSLLSPDLLDTAKVVYLARNPKDVVVSYLHHSRILRLHGYTGSMDQFVQYFVDDDLVYGPYWLHVKEALEKRDHPNLHFIFFEDLKRNNMVELRKLNKFLDTNMTEEQLEKVAKYTSFSEMKIREEAIDSLKEDQHLREDMISTEGGFFRKGEVGDWKQKLSPQHQAKIDQWMDRYTKDFDLPFPCSS
ncbi:sulfotransferase 1C4-like [Panulirus ornatus]|uniref:sulfotransferase 1C4-like n=1 Tax=Panulirus ornatus TaxID=150431 RepID=UPI003A8777D3